MGEIRKFRLINLYLYNYSGDIMRVSSRFSILIFVFVAIGLSAIHLRAQYLTQLDQKTFGAPAENIAVIKGTSIDTVFLAGGRDV